MAPLLTAVANVTVKNPQSGAAISIVTFAPAGFSEVDPVALSSLNTTTVHCTIYDVQSFARTYVLIADVYLRGVAILPDL